jgi:hypothetical protein
MAGGFIFVEASSSSCALLNGYFPFAGPPAFSSPGHTLFCLPPSSRHNSHPTSCLLLLFNNSNEDYFSPSSSRSTTAFIIVGFFGSSPGRVPPRVRLSAPHRVRGARLGALLRSLHFSNGSPPISISVFQSILTLKTITDACVPFTEKNSSPRGFCVLLYSTGASKRNMGRHIDMLRRRRRALRNRRCAPTRRFCTVMELLWLRLTRWYRRPASATNIGCVHKNGREGLTKQCRRRRWLQQSSQMSQILERERREEVI